MASRRKKALVLPGALLVVAVTAGLVVASMLFRSGHTGAASDGGQSLVPQTAFPPGIARHVESQIAAVSGESVLGTIANLASVDMYFWPGGGEFGLLVSIFPLEKREGAREVRMILSNRRFLKVCEELEALGSEASTELLNECIPPYLEEYKGVLDEYLELQEGRHGPGTLGGPGFQIGGPPDGRPNPLGPHFRILALVLAASNLELKGTRDVVWEVVEEALKQRARFYRDDEFSDGFRHGILTMTSLYNRQILGYALLKTCADPMLIDEVVVALGQDLVVKELTAFDAQRTRYDARLMPGPVDYSKGVLKVEYLPPITDQEFDTIVAAVLLAEEQPAEDGQPQ